MVTMRRYVRWSSSFVRACTSAKVEQEVRVLPCVMRADEHAVAAASRWSSSRGAEMNGSPTPGGIDLDVIGLNREASSSSLRTRHRRGDDEG